MQPVCECCNQKIRKLNPHRMDKHKVETLEMMGKAYIQGDGWIQAQAGSGMKVGNAMLRAPYRVQAHVSRLCWFGLAEHGGHRSGKYRITVDGFSFLHGVLSVPAIIHCRDGVVYSRSSSRVYIKDVNNVILDKQYWDDYWKLQI